MLPFPKAGKDPHDASSYRPIALTSTLCKVMERLVANRLVWYLEKHSILTNVQTGFRKNRSTLDQIIRLQDVINRSLRNSGHTLCVFLDFEKAFDMLWRAGLMVKLKSYGINGHMYDWIRDFLSERTIQVRVGADLSTVHKIENGTPQGAMISPILFICMVNDLPDGLDEVESSLFADDSAIYKMGRNMAHLERVVQRNLDRIQSWCDMWGFRISTEKTVAVPFTNSNATVNLKVNGNPIKCVKETKFLGMIFDRKLTWRSHIDHVVTKCKKRLNLMRAVSGKHWGASQKTLLLIYRALIRSVIDYGSIAYDNAAQSQLDRLDSIQCQALRISTGAMTGTSLAVMQAHCGEMPLQLRRLKSQTEYSVKVKNSSGHVAEGVFQDHWTEHYGRFTDRNQPIAVKTSGFHEKHDNLKVTGPQTGNVPPWLMDPPRVDDSLTNKGNKHEQPEALLALSRCLIDHYSDCTRVYTDASKTTDGKVGVGCYIEASAHNGEEKTSQRVTDNVSVYAGEMAAIRLAIQSVAKVTGDAPVAVFSDSLSAVRSIESHHSSSRPNILQDILVSTSSIKSGVTLVWVPSHIGIHGNEIADRLACEGSKKPAVDNDIGLELTEAYSAVDDWCRGKWQQDWTQRSHGHYSQIVSNVMTTTLRQYANRGVEVTANRLQFGRCRLNAYLHQINRHATGLCDKCGVPETVQHYVMECDNEVTRQVKAYCQSTNSEHTLAKVLSNGEIIRIICRESKQSI